MWDSEPESPGKTGREHPGLAKGVARNLGRPRPPPPPVFMTQATFPSGFEVVLQRGGEAAVIPSPPDCPARVFQVDLLHKAILDAAVKKKCEDAQSLIDSAWQRSDSLCRGRAERDPWC